MEKKLTKIMNRNRNVLITSYVVEERETDRETSTDGMDREMKQKR